MSWLRTGTHELVVYLNADRGRVCLVSFRVDWRGGGVDGKHAEKRDRHGKQRNAVSGLQRPGSTTGPRSNQCLHDSSYTIILSDVFFVSTKNTRNK